MIIILWQNCVENQKTNLMFHKLSNSHIHFQWSFFGKNASTSPSNCRLILSVQIQVADFVSTYMPAYKAYLPALYEKGPHGASPEHTLRLDIDEDRNPVG
jgi:hypothetical protein